MLTRRLGRHRRVLAWCLGWLSVTSWLGGCASLESEKPTSRPVQTMWPAPPDPTRFKFVTVLRTISDIRAETEDESLMRALTGKNPSEEIVYEKPTALAARQGRVYVADPERSAVVVFDVPRRRVFRFGTREPNTVSRPNGIALDDEGKAYVLDTRRQTVMVFDGLGLFLRSIGKEKDFEKPVSVAVSRSGDRVYVVDRGSLNGSDHKVVVFDANGEKLREMGPRGKREGEFNIPLDAAITPDGSLVVLDAGNFRVQIFDSEGNFVRAFGRVGNGVGQFSRPRGLAVDDDGNIYVSDASFNNVQIFNPEGELLMAIGGTDMRGAAGEYALVGPLAVDERGFLYVGDLFFRKVEVYQRMWRN